MHIGCVDFRLTSRRAVTDFVKTNQQPEYTIGVYPFRTGICRSEFSDPDLGGKLRSTTDHRLRLSSSSTHLCATTITAGLITGLFEEFALAHFLLDSGVFNQLPKPLNSIIYIFIVAQTQLNHPKASSV